jgi:hypothetical protein
MFLLFRRTIASKQGRAHSLRTVWTSSLDIQAHLSAVMQVGVACSAKGDQIFFTIVTGSAAKFLVVNLKVGHLSA